METIISIAKSGNSQNKRNRSPPQGDLECFTWVLLTGHRDPYEMAGSAISYGWRPCFLLNRQIKGKKTQVKLLANNCIL